MIPLIQIALAASLWALPIQPANTQAPNQAPKPRDHYDVAAYIWPSYHNDKRAKVFWPQGIGEWQTVLANEPKYPGHDQPRRPLWGCVNEADPYVMEMQIAAAADHGVNVFIYDWYWYDGMPFLEGCLNDGYLKARNNSRVKFYLMWANHDVNQIWDKRNADDAFTGRNDSIIWRGSIERPEFEKVARRWIEKYFKQPTYYQINGKPVLMIYDLANFVQGMGGVAKAKDALDWFRQETVKAGFAGLELQVALRQESPHPLVNIPGEKVGTQAEVIKELAFDSTTHYQFAHILDMNRNYEDIARDAAAAWDRDDKRYTGTYYPQVSVGWDASPRAKQYVGAVVKNNTPEQIERAMAKAKAFIDARPERAPLIVVNSWNEWTETSYLEPDDKYGYGYLEAIKRVFGTK